MFSGLTSYFFGSSATEEEEQQKSQTRASPSPKRRAKSPSCGLKTVAATDEEEWMLVDKSSSCASTPLMGRSLTDVELQLHSTPRLPCNYSDKDILIQSLVNLPITTTTPHLSPTTPKCSIIDSRPTDSMSSSQTTSEESETRLKLDELTDRCSDDSDAVLSDISSQPERVTHPSYDESWLVTPPPCFTVGGNSPLRLVSTNPMENLLIEHTSMSVYGPRGRPSSRGHDSDEASESSTNSDRPTGSKKKPAGRAVAALPPRRPRAVALRAGLQAQVQSLKAMQKSKQKREGRHLNKASLNKNNKVQHVSGRQHQTRRKQHILQPSGRSNDRKSQ